MPRSNLKKAQRIALKELRGLEEEVILPAEKGNTTVMVRCGYDGKIGDVGDRHLWEAEW